MILAAGRGERMRPLTDTIPKPLLPVDGKALIVYHLEALRKAGFFDVIINLGYRGEQIRDALKSGQDWGMRIVYSREPETALDTGGGILKALPLLGEQAFLVVNSDVWTDYPLMQLRDITLQMAHLVLVDNPPQHSQGDFHLSNGRIFNEHVCNQHATSRLTFSGISVLHPSLFKNCSAGRFSVTPLLRQAAAVGAVSGEYYGGIWQDIGTPQRLAQLQTKRYQHT